MLHLPRKENTQIRPSQKFGSRSRPTLTIPGLHNISLTFAEISIHLNCSRHDRTRLAVLRRSQSISWANLDLGQPDSNRLIITPSNQMMIWPVKDWFSVSLEQQLCILVTRLKSIVERLYVRKPNSTLCMRKLICMPMKMPQVYIKASGKIEMVVRHPIDSLSTKQVHSRVFSRHREAKDI